VRYAIERHRTKDTSRQLFAAELRREENLRLERGLLPRPLLDDRRFTATTRYRAGGGNRVLGGDFFDTVQLPDGSVRAVIGDVCGHGPDEAALGVSMRIAWRTLVLAGIKDDEVLPMLERLLLVERIEDLFVTVCDLTVAPDRRSVGYRLAGHPSPLLIDESVRELPDDRRGVPLGVTSDAQWATQVQPLGGSWTLLMFTDGLFEVRRGEGSERLGVDGLITMLHGLLAVTDDELEPLDRLLVLVEASHGGPLDDDVAMLALRSHPDP
jgi:serine phosphatase RsbU (regulator of sigma subunit)